MNLLFISSVNLTTNPRIYKEIELASQLGYKITFIGFKLGNWSDEGDEKIRGRMPAVRFVYLDATRNNYLSWLYFSLYFLFTRIIWPMFPRSLKLTALAHSKRTLPMLRLLKKENNVKYDLVVAHTLASLYPSVMFSKKNQCPFSFDVEDYHPGESIESDAGREKVRREFLMRELLPGAQYISAASPLIAGNVEALVKQSTVKTVLNYFPSGEFSEPVLPGTDKIKLVWFSQNINAGRGLELILAIWDSVKSDFELTLIGKLDDDFAKNWLKDHNDIIVRSPMAQKELHHELSAFDAGLAIDVSNDDYNRELAITNKILAYFQAGLYILATNTRAQDQFIKQHPMHGIISEQSASSIQNSLKRIRYDIENIRSQRQLRFSNASLFSWEKESAILKREWKKLQPA
jgi:hypothetical protein